MSEEVLTIKQLAEALKVTEQHLYRELRQKDCKIPVIMIGSSKRFLLSDVLKATASIDDKLVYELIESKDGEWCGKGGCDFSHSSTCHHPGGCKDGWVYKLVK